MNFDRRIVLKSMTRLLVMLLSLLAIDLQAQQSLNGKVVDFVNNETIPFVNIGFVEQAIGTTSNQAGDFILDFEPSKLPFDAVLQFSSLGYKTKAVPLEEIKQLTGKRLKIYLEPTDVALDEVVLFNDGQEFIPDDIGYANFDKNHMGYWKGTKALGGELATRVLAKSGLRKLHKLKFQVVQPPMDSLLLRVNIYNDDGGLSRKPGTNLNKSGKNIFCKVYSYSEIIQVDLNPFGIIAEDNFIVSLELVQYYSKMSPEFALAASYEAWGSYSKLASQAKWVRLSNINMAYQLETSLLVPKRLVERFKETVVKKQKRKRKVSGFVIVNGKMLSNVLVKNIRTGDVAYSNEMGRYIIPAKRADLLSFRKDGFQTSALNIEGETIINVQLQRSLKTIDDRGLTPAIPLN